MCMIEVAGSFLQTLYPFHSASKFIFGIGSPMICLHPKRCFRHSSGFKLYYFLMIFHNPLCHPSVFHRCTMPVFTSGGLEVSSEEPAEYYRWKHNLKYTCCYLGFIRLGADESLLLAGFNLVRRFSLFKNTDVKKIRNPRGPVIFRLGKTALLRPSE